MIYLVPLLISASLLFGTNGLVGTLIPLRASYEMFGLLEIGWMGSAYAGGFLIGSVYGPRLAYRVGYVRAFAALASVASVVVVLHVMWIDSWLWLLLRFFGGVCFAGQFVILDSWLNAMTPNERRGRTLGLYRFIDLLSVVVGQFMVALLPPEGFKIFLLASVLYSLCLLPIAMSRQKSPEQSFSRASLRSPFIFWMISPLAASGVFVTGLTNSTFRSVGPVFAGRLGLDTEGVALFVAVLVMSGALSQFPFGWLSDKLDRRFAIFVATVGATMGGMVMGSWGLEDATWLFGGVALFGACSLALYTLSMAHANDFAGEEDFVSLASGIMTVYAVGAILGPFVATWVSEIFGDRGFFFYFSLVHGSYICVVLWRFFVGRVTPSGVRSGLMFLPKTSVFGFLRVEKKTEEE